MRFLFSRLLQGLLVIWGIITLLFLIFYALGDPTDFIVGDQADQATKDAIRIKYGLDKPLFFQYTDYLNALSPLGYISNEQEDPLPHVSLIALNHGILAIKSPDLGRSFQSRKRVSRLITGRIEGTLILALTAISFAALLGIFFGILSANMHNSWLDKSILSISVLGISAPSYFMGVFVAWLFAVKYGAFTGLPVTGYMFEPNIFDMGRNLKLSHLFLPALALGIRPLAVFIQLTRSSMLDVLGSDYVRTARAKGLAPWKVLIRHALRNALNPVITSITGWLASLLAGAFFIEYIFNWQGIGKLTIDSLNTNDFPVILGCAIFIGGVFVLISIFTDYLYKVLDPRVNLRG